MSKGIQDKNITFDEFRKAAWDFASKEGFLAIITPQINVEFFNNLIKHGLISDDELNDLTSFLKNNFNMFMDWFLFEKILENEKSIAETMVETTGFKGVTREEVLALKSPTVDVFLVEHSTSKISRILLLSSKKHVELDVTPLNQGLEEGKYYAGKLFVFKGKYHVSGRLIEVPIDIIENLKEDKKFYDELQDYINAKLDKLFLSVKEEILVHHLLDLFFTYLLTFKINNWNDLEQIDLVSFFQWVRRRSPNLKLEEEIKMRELLEYLLSSKSR